MDQNETHTEQLPVRVYSAQRSKGVFSDLKTVVKEFRFAHALGYRLAERNIRSKYRQSLLGIVWAIVPPLATAFVWIFLNSMKVVNFQNVGAPYPVFVLTGIMLWSVFSSAVLAPMNVVQANRNILVKINFPREALLVSAFYEILFNAFFALVIIGIELLAFGVHVDYSSLLFIPGVLLLIIVGVAFGLLILPVSLLYKDVQFVLPTFLQFCMYLTPVLYAKPIFTGLARILDYNPVGVVLVSARSWLLGLGTAYSPAQIGIVFGAALVLLLLGIRLQRLSIGIIIERMGS